MTSIRFQTKAAYSYQLNLEGHPSKETIELSEDSELIKFNTEPLKKLSKKDLSIAHLFYTVLFDYTLWLENRLYQLQFMTSQERWIGPF
ncbi:MAG: hypothetical protein AAFN93_26345 [Bacteroidota bacterium]